MMLHKLMHHPVMVHLRKPCHQDYAKLVLRLALGAVFVYHGWGKLNGLDGVEMFFGKLGIPAPGLMAPFIACVEFFGGLSMILGLGTRVSGFLLACTMLVAIVQAKGLVWAKSELEISLLAMAASLVFSGAGEYSLDAKLMKKSSGEHAASMPMPQKQA